MENNFVKNYVCPNGCLLPCVLTPNKKTFSLDQIKNYYFENASSLKLYAIFFSQKFVCRLENQDFYSQFFSTKLFAKLLLPQYSWNASACNSYKMTNLDFDHLSNWLFRRKIDSKNMNVIIAILNWCLRYFFQNLYQHFKNERQRSGMIFVISLGPPFGFYSWN